MDSGLYRHRVGQPYMAGRAAWPEASEYNWRGGAHELRLFWRTPSDREVESVRRGEAQFAFAVDGPILFFLYRFGDGAMDWSDAPYSAHMVPPEQRQDPPDLAPGQGMLLTTILVDAGTGLVRAIRATSMGPHFSRELHAAIRRQMADPFDQGTYDRHLERVYARSSTRDLLKQARARTKGGQ